MRINVLYLLFTLSSSILFADFACAYTLLGIKLYGPLDLPGSLIVAILRSSTSYFDAQDDDGCDFLCRASQNLEAARREAENGLNKAKQVATDMGHKVNEFTTSVEEVVRGIVGLRVLSENEDAAGARFKRSAINLDALSAELTVAYEVMFNELRESFPEPKEAPGHENRSKAIEVALEKVGVVLVEVCSNHGLDQYRVEESWQVLHPYMSTTLVLLGDIVEQHPVLFESLLFAMATAFVPETWFFRPFLGLFGFGRQGPIKGSAAAWAQRVFFGARVERGSWFSRMQRAGMAAAGWWSRLWCSWFGRC
ncbi:hypothetical protein HMN09_01268700 [Mycena chlorophos]|uniref:Uncharacterized protein n=1 Tax=Mycena chlorophos TaxID=658473 RepID=A0A8H6S1V2_MYCCL|nr:hypothetical protein HMN09_01268700 [Mycena chlorophos]